jgi:hypothetical protein
MLCLQRHVKLVESILKMKFEQRRKNAGLTFKVINKTKQAENV